MGVCPSGIIVTLLVLLVNYPALLFSFQDIRCPYGCLTCLGGVHCPTCINGFYSVREGAYTQCKECPSRCSLCFDHWTVYCVACTNETRYGKDCREICSKGCLNSTCGKTSGACSCRDNYEGNRCDSCAKGKYEMDSDCVMDCPQNCKRCISATNCTECKNGFFGDVCEFNCSRGCFLDKCSKSNGTCYQEKCKPNFDGTNCTNCSSGLHGTSCKLPCPKSCISCSSSTSCDKCKHGYWGKACEHTCYHWFCVGNN